MRNNFKKNICLHLHHVTKIAQVVHKCNYDFEGGGQGFLMILHGTKKRRDDWDMTPQGVNFTIILRAAFMRTDPTSA